MNFYDCSKKLPELKDALPWLRDADSTALQSSLRDLDTAHQNFFRGLKQKQFVGYPRFKSKKNRYQSYKSKRVGENIAIVGNKLKLPKLGLVECRFSREVEGRILSATVSRVPSGEYFVSLCCTDVENKPFPSTGSTVGVDVGIKTLAVTSDGVEYPNPKHLAESEKKLARLQRKLSRKTKGGRRWEKARLQVARLQEHIANQRNDALHKLSTGLIRENDVICIEKLSPKNMVRNHKLAKSISDAS